MTTVTTERIFGRTVRAICPYCGVNNAVHVEGIITREIVNCDVDGGGCDRTFVVKIEVVTTATTTAAALPEDIA